MDSSSSSSLDSHRAAYSPSAPPVPDPNQEPRLAHPYYPSRSSQDQYYRPPASSSSSSSYAGHTYHQSQYPTLTPTGSLSSNYGSGHSSHSYPGYGYGYPPPQPQQQQQYQSYNYNASFPPGTDPGVIRTFQMVDRDGSGFIEESELRQALSSGYQRFSMRTIRLLIFLFKNPSDSALRIGKYSGQRFFNGVFSGFLLYYAITLQRIFFLLWLFKVYRVKKKSDLFWFYFFHLILTDTFFPWCL